MNPQGILRATFLVAVFGFFSLQVRADEFAFSYYKDVFLAGPEKQTLFVSASGVLTTTNTEVDGALTITGITGTRTTNWFMGSYLNPPETDTITGVLPVGFLPSPGPDNLLYPNNSSAYIDDLGFAYSLKCSAECGSLPGDDAWVVSGASPGSYTELGEFGLGGGGNRSGFTLVAIPEPKSVALLVVAMFGVLLYRLRLAWR